MIVANIGLLIKKKSNFINLTSPVYHGKKI